jgi:hypothetical protein
VRSLRSRSLHGVTRSSRGGTERGGGARCRCSGEQASRRSRGLQPVPAGPRRAGVTAWKLSARR